MLDLNLVIVSCESSSSAACDDREKNFMGMTTTDFYHKLQQETLRTQMEDSGTSNSSIINCEESPTAANIGDENSSNNVNSSPFIFDILRKHEPEFIITDEKAKAKAQATVQAEYDDNYNKHQALVTRKLFPVVAGEKDDGDTESSVMMMSSMSRPQWLNLSFTEPGASSTSEQELKSVKQKQPKKSRRGPRSKSSQYRGVTFYRRTSRWESHIWDCGKQVYLGGFDTAHTAARAYDRAAVKFRGNDADLNFNLSDYEEDMKQMKHLSKEEFVLILRRQSNGFARGSSKYRGVTLHKCGRWEARMGQLLGKKAYDKAAIKYNGREAVTNFEPSAYDGDMVLNSNNGGSGCHDLDLSLGISQPSTGPNGNANPGNSFLFGCDACEMPNKEGPLLESYSYASMGVQLHPHHGLAMAPEQPSKFVSILPGVLQNHEEPSVKEKRVQAISSPEFTNWPWQMYSNGSVAAMPVLTNIAASSGFSSACCATASPATIPVRNTSLATQNISAAINTSHFCNYRS